MKKVIKYVLKEQGGSEFDFYMSMSKRNKAKDIIANLLYVKNKTLREGEGKISVVAFYIDRKITCYDHDWERTGRGYRCIDCGVRGKRKTPLTRIIPVQDDPMYKDCKWKIKED